MRRLSRARELENSVYPAPDPLGQLRRRVLLARLESPEDRWELVRDLVCALAYYGCGRLADRFFRESITSLGGEGWHPSRLGMESVRSVIRLVPLMTDGPTEMDSLQPTGASQSVIEELKSHDERMRTWLLRERKLSYYAHSHGVPSWWPRYQPLSSQLRMAIDPEVASLELLRLTTEGIPLPSDLLIETQCLLADYYANQEEWETVDALLLSIHHHASRSNLPDGVLPGLSSLTTRLLGGVLRAEFKASSDDVKSLCSAALYSLGVTGEAGVADEKLNPT